MRHLEEKKPNEFCGIAPNHVHNQRTGFNLYKFSCLSHFDLKLIGILLT